MTLAQVIKRIRILEAHIEDARALGQEAMKALREVKRVTDGVECDALKETARRATAAQVQAELALERILGVEVDDHALQEAFAGTDFLAKGGSR